jgi:hypothetical protein
MPVHTAKTDLVWLEIALFVAGFSGKMARRARIYALRVLYCLAVNLYLDHNKYAPLLS